MVTFPIKYIFTLALLALVLYLPSHSLAQWPSALRIVHSVKKTKTVGEYLKALRQVLPKSDLAFLYEKMGKNKDEKIPKMIHSGVTITLKDQKSTVKLDLISPERGYFKVNGQSVAYRGNIKIFYQDIEKMLPSLKLAPGIAAGFFEAAFFVTILSSDVRSCLHNGQNIGDKKKNPAPEMRGLAGTKKGLPACQVLACNKKGSLLRYLNRVPDKKAKGVNLQKLIPERTKWDPWPQINAPVVKLSAVTSKVQRGIYKSILDCCTNDVSRLCKKHINRYFLSEDI